jgi:hypothetical protein
VGERYDRPDSAQVTCQDLLEWLQPDQAEALKQARAAKCARWHLEDVVAEIPEIKNGISMVGLLRDFGVREGKAASESP